MKRDIGKILYSAGLVLLVVQLLFVAFNIVNGSNTDAELFAVEEATTFTSIVTSIWSSALGTVLLIVLFFRRIAGNKEGVFEIIGSLLWVFQLFTLFDTGMSGFGFILKYAMGIVGTICVFATGIYDLCTGKNS
ncbi:MAG: hypothetical protein ACI4GZ_02230 [Ruminococcus sp.]